MLECPVGYIGIMKGSRTMHGLRFFFDFSQSCRCLSLAPSQLVIELFGSCCYSNNICEKEKLGLQLKFASPLSLFLSG
jgi:hypothetical protein